VASRTRLRRLTRLPGAGPALGPPLGPAAPVGLAADRIGSRAADRCQLVS